MNINWRTTSMLDAGSDELWVCKSCKLFVYFSGKLWPLFLTQVLIVLGTHLYILASFSGDIKLSTHCWTTLVFDSESKNSVGEVDGRGDKIFLDVEGNAMTCSYS